MMDKLKVYQVIAITMVIFNVALLAFFLFGAKPEGRRPLPRADKQLQLDQAQHEAFLVEVKAHQGQMKKINDQQKELLKGYFQQLATEVEVPPAVPPEFTRLEQEKIQRTYQHLLTVKGLLRPEQEERFPRFTEIALRRILLGNKKPPPPKK